MVARCSKRMATRSYQLKTGHCLTGQYLRWTKDGTTAKCGWCSYKVQTREHLLKKRPRWKPQQKTLWVEVWRETGREKNRFKIRDLFVDERCTRPILDFLRTIEVGRRVEPRGASKIAQSQDSEWEDEEEQKSGNVLGSDGGKFAFPFVRPFSLSFIFALSFLMSVEAGIGQAGARGVTACRLRTARGRGGR